MHNSNAHPKDFITVAVLHKIEGQWPRLKDIQVVDITYERFMDGFLTRDDWWTVMEKVAKAISGMSQSQDTVPRLLLEKIPSMDAYMPALQEWSNNLGKFATAYARKNGSTPVAFLETVCGEAKRVWEGLEAHLYMEGIQNLNCTIEALAHRLQIAAGKYHYALNHDPAKAATYTLQGSKLFPIFDKNVLGKVTENEAGLVDFKESEKTKTDKVKEPKPGASKKREQSEKYEPMCYNCRERGHKASECTKPKAAPKENKETKTGTTPTPKK